MAQTTINFNMDEDLKIRMETVCGEMGLSMDTAFNIFATKIAREMKFPFDVSADPFYSEANMKRLRKSIANLKAGRGKEHELIEVE
jgi:DNA-damage-inducible protein J